MAIISLNSCNILKDFLNNEINLTTKENFNNNNKKEDF